MGRKLWGWLLDYGYLTYWTVRGLLSRSSPEQWLQPGPRPGSPVLLLPGVFESWRFLQPVAEHLYAEGHPVHVLAELGWNAGAIPDQAVLVAERLERDDLHDVTIVAHSKGGLIAKQALTRPDTLARVRHVVTVNTPFAGSRYAAFVLLPSVRMFAPDAPVIRALAREVAVNHRISSFSSVFDPHIPGRSRLPGAENVLLPAVGHFRPLADPRTLRLISAVLERPVPDQPVPEGLGRHERPAGQRLTADRW